MHCLAPTGAWVFDKVKRCSVQMSVESLANVSHSVAGPVSTSREQKQTHIAAPDHLANCNGSLDTTQGMRGRTPWTKRWKADSFEWVSKRRRCWLRMSLSAPPAGGSLNATSSEYVTSRCNERDTSSRHLGATFVAHCHKLLEVPSMKVP